MPAFGAFSKTEIDVAFAGTTTDDTPSVMNVTGSIFNLSGFAGAVGCRRLVDIRKSRRSDHGMHALDQSAKFGAVIRERGIKLAGGVGDSELGASGPGAYERRWLHPQRVPIACCRRSCAPAS